MIYIAGKYIAKERLKEEREAVRRMGFTVSSTWMDQPEVGYVFNGATEEEQNQRKLDEATRDFNEVRVCNIFIIDTLDESATGGREVELGIAMDSRALIIRVGPERNIFHALADGVFETWDECKGWLDSLN